MLDDHNLSVHEQLRPLSHSLDSSNTVYVDLLEARTERMYSYEGRNARDALADTKRIIADHL